MASAPSITKTKSDPTTEKLIDDKLKLFSSDFRNEFSEIYKELNRLETEQKEIKNSLNKQNEHLEYNQIIIGESKQAIVEERNLLERVFDDLKKPVDKVVDNLNQLYKQIPGQQGHLLECITIAEEIKQQFMQSKNYFKEANMEFEEDFVEFDLRYFLEQLLMNKRDSKLKLFAERALESTLQIKGDVLALTIDSVISRLRQSLGPDVVISVKALKNQQHEIESKVGMGYYLEIIADIPTDIAWKGTFEESYSEKFPLTWLARRSNLRKFNGDMTIISENDLVKGVKIKLPIKYQLPKIK